MVSSPFHQLVPPIIGFRFIAENRRRWLFLGNCTFDSDYSSGFSFRLATIRAKFSPLMVPVVVHSAALRSGRSFVVPVERKFVQKALRHLPFQLSAFMKQDCPPRFFPTKLHCEQMKENELRDGHRGTAWILVDHKICDVATKCIILLVYSHC